MKQMKTIKFPDNPETYEIVDAQARADLDYLRENITIDEADPTVPAWAKEASKPTYTADEVGAAPATHNQAASTITAGTFAEAGVKAMNGTDYSTARIRNIYAGTTNLTPGSSTLANGSIYLVYE